MNRALARTNNIALAVPLYRLALQLSRCVVGVDNVTDFEIDNKNNN